MAPRILTRHAQGSSASIGAVADPSDATLYLSTDGDLRPVRITRFEWMDQATYDGLAVKAGTTLYGITTGERGRGTAHRWHPAMVDAVAYYLGDTAAVPAATALELLREATFFIDAAYSTEGEQVAKNQGTGGSVLDAQYGSVGPGLFLRDGTATYSGAASNAMTVPDAANLDITGDIEVVVRSATPPDGGSSPKTLASKMITSANEYSWAYEWYGTTLYFIWTTGGTSGTQTFGSSNFLGSLTFGEMYWFKATLDTSTGKCRLYWAADQATEPSVWTEVATQAGAGATSIYSGAADVGLGAQSSGSGAHIGDWKRCIIRDGIDGPVVLDADTSTAPDWATEFTATTGQTVTVTSTGADTNDPLLLTHTGDNYLSIQGPTGTYPLQVPGTDETVINESVELVFCLDDPSWQATYICPIGWGHPGGTYHGVMVYLNTDMKYYVFVNDGNADGLSHLSVVAPPEGTRWWKINIELSPSNGNAFITAETSADSTNDRDSVTWTALDTREFGRAMSTITTNVADPFTLGNTAYTPGVITNGNMFHGSAKVDGVDEVVVDFPNDTAGLDGGATSFTTTTGQTANINRATTGRKTTLVTRPLWLFGTDDFLRVPANSAFDIANGDPYSILVVYQAFDTPSANARFVSCRTTPDGWVLAQGDPDGSIQAYLDGDSGIALDVVLPTNPIGVRHCAGWVRPAGGGDLMTYVDSETAFATDASGTVATNDLSIGSDPNNTNYLDAEIFAVATWPRALTTDEIAALSGYYGTGA